jgi:predicted peptidase
VPRAHYRQVHKEEAANSPTVQAQVDKKRQGLRLKLPRLRLGRWGCVGALLAIAVLLADLGWLFVYVTGEKDPLRYEQFVRPSGDRVQYALYVPPTYRSAERYPLIVYLQVPGKESTADKLRFPGISLAIDLALERKEPFDFLVLFPGGKQGKWDPGSDESAVVVELVDEVCRRFSVDEDRVLLTGLANGGRGVWNLAGEYPDRWAAIVPLTALRGSVPAVRVASIPCWCFHSELNGLEQGRTEMKALEQAGGKPRLTEVSAGGTIWNQTYLNKELYGWLTGQRRKSK